MPVGFDLNLLTICIGSGQITIYYRILFVVFCFNIIHIFFIGIWYWNGRLSRNKFSPGTQNTKFCSVKPLVKSSDKFHLSFVILTQNDYIWSRFQTTGARLHCSVVWAYGHSRCKHVNEQSIIRTCLGHELNPCDIFVADWATHTRIQWQMGAKLKVRTQKIKYLLFLKYFTQLFYLRIWPSKGRSGKQCTPEYAPGTNLFGIFKIFEVALPSIYLCNWLEFSCVLFVSWNAFKDFVRNPSFSALTKITTVGLWWAYENRKYIECRDVYPHMVRKESLNTPVFGRK